MSVHVRRVTGDHPICKESEEELAHSGLWEAAEGKVHCTRIQMTWVPVLELLLVVQAVPSQAGYLNSLDGLQVPTHKRRFCFIFASSKILLSWVHSSNAYSKASQTSYLRHLGPPQGTCGNVTAGCHTVGRCYCCWRVVGQDRDATKHPKIQGELPTTKTLTPPNFHSAEIEKH